MLVFSLRFFFVLLYAGYDVCVRRAHDGLTDFAARASAPMAARRYNDDAFVAKRYGALLLYFVQGGGGRVLWVKWEILVQQHFALALWRRKGFKNGVVGVLTAWPGIIGHVPHREPQCLRFTFCAMTA